MDFKGNTLIESIGTYLPKESLTTDEILSGCKHKIKFPLERITGIKSRRVGGKKEFSIDLARNAILDCLKKSKYQVTDIDLLVCCNISRYDGLGLLSMEPGTSIRLREELGFINAIAYDITNACAGMFTGIYIVDSLLKAGAIRRGLVVSGENITHLAFTAQKEIEGYLDTRLACLTLGDAGAALILESSANQNIGFVEFDLQTFGQYSKYCISKPSDYCGMIMYTDAVNLTDVAIDAGAEHSLQMLQNAGLPPKSFQHLIMHQTSKMSLNSARNEINRLLESQVFEDSNTVNNLEERGNTASTSHVIALADNISNQNIHSGDKVAFSISASGLTIGTALYVFDDLPDRVRLIESHAQPKPKEKGALGDVMPGKNRSLPRVRIEGIGIIPENTGSANHSLELLQTAAKDCFKKSSYDCNDIGLLIYSGVYRTEYVLEPAYATLLAGKLNMNASRYSTENKTLAFDIFNGAVGFLSACYTAQGFIGAGKLKTAMIVAAEIENNAEHYPEKMIGVRETASSIILDTHPSNNNVGFSNFVFHYQHQSIDAYISYFDNPDGKPFLYISRDNDLETLYINCIDAAVNEILEKEGVDINQVDRIFPPQISKNFISNLIEFLNLPREKVIDITNEGLDYFSSSIPYALAHASEQGLVKPGDLGLIITAGSGVQVGCATYYF